MLNQVVSRALTRPAPSVSIHQTANGSVSLELLSAKAASHVALSDVPLEDRCKLQSGQLTRCEAVRAIGDFADSIRARLIEVALGDVRRVEVDHRSSRSSDWYTAESTGTFERFNIAASRLGRGRRVMEASKG